MLLVGGVFSGPLARLGNRELRRNCVIAPPSMPSVLSRERPVPEGRDVES
jgi:hypothetical protein